MTVTDAVIIWLASGAILALAACAWSGWKGEPVGGGRIILAAYWPIALLLVIAAAPFWLASKAGKAARGYVGGRKL